MTTIIYPSPFQLNSDYFPNNPNQSTQNNNIYLGGNKSPNPLKTSKTKGITLTKSILTPQKLSNLNYIQQTTSKIQPIPKPQLFRVNSFLKPNFQTNLSHSSPIVHQSVQRAFSSPSIKRYHFCSSPVLINGTYGHKKNTNLNLLPEKTYPIIRFSASSSLRSSTDLIPKNSSLNVSQNFFHKIHQVNPAEKLRLNSSSREKIIFVSPNKKITFATVCAANNQNASSNRFLSTNWSQNTIEKSQNIYYQMGAPKANLRGLKNQRVRPVKMINRFRPTSPLPMRRESLEFRVQKRVQKQEWKENYVCIPSLKHSKSTAQEQESPYNSSKLLEERREDKDQESVQRKYERKVLKNSIKSLWDSVDKCAVSVICQNLQDSQTIFGQTGFKNEIHKGYNTLGQEFHFN